MPQIYDVWMHFKIIISYFLLKFENLFKLNYLFNYKLSFLDSDSLPKCNTLRMIEFRLMVFWYFFTGLQVIRVLTRMVAMSEKHHQENQMKGQKMALSKSSM